MRTRDRIDQTQEVKLSGNGAPDIWQVMFTRNPDVSWTTLEGETVLLNLENGCYYTLNRVSSVIWEQFSGEQSLGEVLAVVHERFDVDEDVVREDLEALVTKLCHEGLIAEGKKSNH